MSIAAKYFFQIKTDANRCHTVSKPPCTVNRTEASVPRCTVKRYIVSPLVSPWPLVLIFDIPIKPNVQLLQIKLKNAYLMFYVKLPIQRNNVKNMFCILHTCPIYFMQNCTMQRLQIVLVYNAI